MGNEAEEKGLADIQALQYLVGLECLLMTFAETGIPDSAFCDCEASKLT